MNKEDYFKYYIQGSDHYLIPKDIFEELFNEMNNWKEESKATKEVAEEHLKKEIQYKEVIEEIREEVKKSSLEVNTREYGMLTVCNSEDLLQILDKGESNE